MIWARLVRRGSAAAMSAALPLALAATVVLLTGGSPAGAAAPALAVPPGLPPLPALAAVTCPSATTCYAAGTSTSHASLVTTRDGGRTWTVSGVAGAVGFAGIACITTVRCVAVGSNATGGAAIAVTADGRSWAAESSPPTLPLDAVTCRGSGRCMAVGWQFVNQQFTSTVLTSSDGGTTWATAAAPAVAAQPDALNAVQCVTDSRCYVVGGRAWVSDDFGAAWRDISPPDGCTPGAGFCAPTYSELNAVQFSDPEHGAVGGAEQCGGQGVTQCPAAFFRTSDGGASWTPWAAANAALPTLLGVHCDAAGCLALANTFSSATVLRSTDGVTWTSGPSVAGTLTALACATSGPCVAVGHRGAVGVLLAGNVAAANPSATGTSSGGGDIGAAALAANPAVSAFSASLPAPSAVAASTSTLVLGALVVVALILLVVFPAQLFNRTYEENHEAIRQWWQRRLPWWRADAGVRSAGARGAQAFVAVAIVGAALGTLLDTAAGWNQHTLLLFAGIVLSLLLSTAVGAAVTATYRRARGRSLRWQLRGLPSGLVVGAACVLISRLADFHPGYLYGVIGGVAFAGQLPRRDEGHLVALSALATLLVSAAAWLLWVPLSAAAARPGAGWATALLLNVLSALFVGGLVGVVIGLVPLRFLPGEKLAAWHWGAWTAVFAIALFGLLQIMLRPQSAAAHVSSVPLWTTVGLFVAFGAASVAFWACFRGAQPAPARPRPAGERRE